MLLANETVMIVDRDRLIDAVEFHLARALQCFSSGRLGQWEEGLRMRAEFWIGGHSKEIRDALENVLEEQKMLSERRGHVRAG